MCLCKGPVITQQQEARGGGEGKSTRIKGQELSPQGAGRQQGADPGFQKKRDLYIDNILCGARIKVKYLNGANIGELPIPPVLFHFIGGPK